MFTIYVISLLDFNQFFINIKNIKKINLEEIQIDSINSDHSPKLMSIIFIIKIFIELFD